LEGQFDGTDYIWFADQPVAQAFSDPSQPTRYTFTDHLGTPILQTDATAAVVWRAEYEPYGSIYTYRAGDADDPQALRLPGQEAAESGPSNDEYNIFRWYRSGWGRYTQADPIELRGGQNLYGYVDSDPVSDEDPFGLSARKKNCTKYAMNIAGALKHAQHHKDSKQSSRDICGMLNHWYNKFQDDKCWKIFPRHGELAMEYLDKFCGGPGSCYGQHEEDPWWQKLNKWLAEQQKSIPPMFGAPPPFPGFEPVPIPIPVP
jgi:RHS repeat-associated protein